MISAVPAGIRSRRHIDYTGAPLTPQPQRGRNAIPSWEKAQPRRTRRRGFSPPKHRAWTRKAPAMNSVPLPLKHRAVPCFTDSLQNQEFRERSVGSHAREGVVVREKKSRSEGPARIPCAAPSALIPVGLTNPGLTAGAIDCRLFEAPVPCSSAVNLDFGCGFKAPCQSWLGFSPRSESRAWA